MKLRPVRVTALLAVLVLVVAACGGNGGETTTTVDQTTTSSAPGPTQPGDTTTTTTSPEPLSGSLLGTGATFPQNVYDLWIHQYTNLVQTGVSINYPAGGSGAGRAGFIAGDNDWGTSEGFMSSGDIEAVVENRACEPDQWPALFGGVAVGLGNPDLDELVLTADVIADIFEARITRWNDPAIAELNAGVSLPDERIIRVVRSDSSGTTQVFTTYLENHAARFDTGGASLPDWPVDESNDPPSGGSGNAGVTDLLNANPASIAYVGQDYALANNVAMAKVVNSDGNATSPTLEAVQEALAGITIPINENFAVRDIGGTGYPIIAVVWNITAPCGQADSPRPGDTAALLIDFWTWAISSPEARSLALGLNFVPLPENMIQPTLDVINRIGSED